jgi:hypothetical protein
MRKYIDEMKAFKARQLQALGRSDRAIAEYAEELKDSPEVGIINSPSIFQYVATRRIALHFMEQFCLYEGDPSDWDPGDKPKRFFNMFYMQCENEVVARSKTPRDIRLGEQLMYEAIREQYSDELVYLSARKNFLERETT